MAHNVSFSVPSRSLGRANVEFQVWEDGEMHGTLQVSKGTLVWFPSKTRYGYRMGWGRFHDIMVKNATSFEKKK